MLLKSNSPEVKWIIGNANKNDFAASLDRRLLTKGWLSDNQLIAVQRIIGGIAERAAAPAIEAVEVKGVERIEEAFNTVRATGLKRIKLRLGAFQFKPAPATGKNAGAIYVNEGDEYLGKVVDGKFHATRACLPAQQEAIVAVCSDPAKAAVAYGQQTGTCACCGRELTDPVSIERGIGPVCADGWGF
jgi:hypothetical protein